MQIDLLVSAKGEMGLLADAPFASQPSGVIYDGIERSLTLEFAESYDSLALNVPLADELAHRIIHLDYLHFGVIENGRVMHGDQLPLMLVNVSEEELYG